MLFKSECRVAISVIASPIRPDNYRDLGRG